MQRGLCDFYCTYDLYGQYVQSEQIMLNRRTALLIDYENANRNWDKAKAHRKDEVRCFTFTLMSGHHHGGAFRYHS